MKMWQMILHTNVNASHVFFFGEDVRSGFFRKYLQIYSVVIVHVHCTVTRTHGKC